MRGNKYVPFMLKRGDGRTLDLDFTQGVLDSRITFTRASTATFINSSGLVASASNNVPRFDYDPSTLAPRGLLVEGQATNLLNWSEAFATSGGTNNNWGDTNITRTSTNNTDPAGGTTALRITASAGNGTIISSAAIGTSAARTFSVWLRRVTGTGNIQYTPTNGATYTTQAITSSWVRYTFTHTANHQVGIRIVTSGDAIELWGAQLETGSGASSYTPTGASQGTRAADTVRMSSTNFSSWFNATGTFLVEHEASFATSQDRVQIGLGIYNAGTAAFCLRRTSSQYAHAIWGNGGNGYQEIAQSGIAVRTPDRSGMTLDSSAKTVRGFANGTVLTNAATTTGTFTTPDRLFIGAQSGGGTDASRDWQNGHIRSIVFWPFVQPDATLQSLTT